MIDLYLRADGEEQALAALPDFATPAGAWRQATLQWAIDPIGVLDGAAGWHANIRLVDESLLPVIQSTGLLIDLPETPARGWA